MKKKFGLSDEAIKAWEVYFQEEFVAKDPSLENVDAIEYLFAPSPLLARIQGKLINIPGIMLLIAVISLVITDH